MKRSDLHWRMVVWMLAIGWIPVIAEELLDSLFHLSQRNCCDILILIIPYIEFITLPLTFLAVLAALFKAANATVRFFQNNNSSK